MDRFGSMKGYKWTLLVHQMPPKPTSGRVKVWRRLQSIGAMPIKDSVYILPLTKEAYEDFQWIREEIIAQKGDATIFKVDSIEGINDEDIINRFQRARDKDYDEIASKTLSLKKNIEVSIKKYRTSTIQKERYETELKKLKARLNEVISLDYFQAPNREKTENAITNCNGIIEGLKVSQEKALPVEKGSPIKIYNKNEFQIKTWVTRKGLHIDRIASGWLIRRFIDKGAKFFFIAEDDIVKNGIGFDVYNVEFSHHGEDCTFETLLKRFDLKDPALVQIAEIVHDIDLKDGKFGRAEAAGINQIIIG
ncbi:MAG: chromate resistance protein, partial [Candidatus Brocadiales bacterium]|nr:chromate resistance protein [Candidatus Brocadiales bacterium]